MKLAKDKQLHIIAGLLIGATASFLGWYALPLAIIVAVGKEVIYDKLMGRGTPEVLDAVYTIGAAGIITTIIQILV